MRSPKQEPRRRPQRTGGQARSITYWALRAAHAALPGAWTARTTEYPALADHDGLRPRPTLCPGPVRAFTAGPAVTA
jgi:hypothetical protein